MTIFLQGGMELLAFVPNNHKANSCYERKTAKDRGDGNGLLAFMAYLNWADVYIFFLMREADSARDEADDAENDKDETDDCGRFHLEGLSDEPDRYSNNRWDAM